MSEDDFKEFIERIKRTAAGEYGTKHFMLQKHEHWKFLWAAERIAELEAENKTLTVENGCLSASCKVAQSWEDRLHEVREIYVGMEGFKPDTAAEGYCLRIIEQMYKATLEGE